MEIKTKANKWYPIKPKSFGISKETVNPVKRQPSKWEKIIANETTDKGLISKIYKQLIWHPTPVLLPGKSHGQNSLVGYSPWGLEELDTTERLSDFTFHFHSLEKEMATHSSVLAWRIPGTGEPGGLPSMGSHRVGHD